MEENCVKQNGQGFWNDCPCSNSNSIICKKPAEHSFCGVEIANRRDCGWYGIQDSVLKKSKNFDIKNL
jgi:hypothetical protein